MRLSQCGAQRCGLQLRKRFDELELGVQQQVQSTESDLCLRLHSTDAQHAHVGDKIRGMVQQRGLTDAVLSLDHNRAAGATARMREQLIDERQFLRAPAAPR